MNTKPFNLGKALNGEPVILRNGLKAYVRYHESELETAPPLLGFFEMGGSLGIGQWAENGEFYWGIGESDFDIVGMWVEPVVFEHWNLLREDVKYLAKDSNGHWFGYPIKPYKDDEEWIIRHGGGHSVNILNPKLFPDCDWKNSLIERPENE